MNDQAAPAEVAATRSSGTLNILLVVLVLMIAAMAYDKLVARPKVQKAFDLVTAANEEINASADRRAMTNKDVQEVLGRGPDSTEEVNTYMVERYGYRGGLLLKKHYYYAAYTGDEANGYKFRTHGTHEMPELQDPNFPPPRAEVADSGDHGAPPPGPPSGADVMRQKQRTTPTASPTRPMRLKRSSRPSPVPNKPTTPSMQWIR